MVPPAPGIYIGPGVRLRARRPWVGCAYVLHMRVAVVCDAISPIHKDVELTHLRLAAQDKILRNFRDWLIPWSDEVVDVVEIRRRVHS